MEDFRERIKHYEKAYETIADDSLQYIKVCEFVIIANNDL